MEDPLATSNILTLVTVAGVVLPLLKRHWYRFTQILWLVAMGMTDAKVIRWMITTEYALKTRLILGGLGIAGFTLAFVWAVWRVQQDMSEAATEVKSLRPYFDKLTDFEKAVLRRIVLIGRSTKILDTQESTLISIAEKTGFLTRTFVGHYELNQSVREPLQTLLASDRSCLVSAEPGLGLSVTVKSEGRELRMFKNNEIAGEANRSLEGFLISFDPPIDGLGLSYMGHFEVARDVTSVKDGEFLIGADPRQQLEGFAITLTGAAASKFQVFYGAHAPGFGDYDECSNGEFCGSRNRRRSLDTIIVRVVPRDVNSISDISSRVNPLTLRVVQLFSYLV